jgi:pantoate--beta-alanine ligase
MPEKDFAMLESEGCNYVFFPEVDEMYPVPDTRIFNFGQLETVMEGARRPGHFNGVAQIVSKLFDAVNPHNAYFGEKDFQQLAIIRQLVKNLNLGINIVSCPIIREPDGLAMSSRNMLLGANERMAAPLIYDSLKKATKMRHSSTIAQVKKWVTESISANSFLKPEYFEIVDALSLQAVENWADTTELRACIAVKAGNVRLIDNIGF